MVFDYVMIILFLVYILEYRKVEEEGVQILRTKKEYLNVISLKLQRITAETDFTCTQTMNSLWL